MPSACPSQSEDPLGRNGRVTTTSLVPSRWYTLSCSDSVAILVMGEAYAHPHALAQLPRSVHLIVGVPCHCDSRAGAGTGCAPSTWDAPGPIRPTPRRPCCPLPGSDRQSHRGRAVLAGEFVQEVGYGTDDPSRPIRKALHLGGTGDTAQDQDRLEAGFDACHDVGVHAVAYHHGRLGVRPQRVERLAHHQRIRLADEVGGDARRLLYEGRDRSGGGQDPLERRPRRVGVGGDEPGTTFDEANRPRDGLETVGPCLPEDDVVRAPISEDCLLYTSPSPRDG